MRLDLRLVVIYIAVVFCALFCSACSDDVRDVNLTCDSLGAETWLEVEKNEVVKICIDSKVRVWDNAPNTEVLNDSCLKYRVPTLVGVRSIDVKFLDSDSSHKINLAVGMKYLNFKNEETLYGNDYYQMNPFEKKIVHVTGSYLVDKYPVTNCEILQLLWNEIPEKSPKLESMENDFTKFWVNRKELTASNGKCIVHDSAASAIPLYLAMKYANIRSIREGLKPYYIFSNTRNRFVRIERRAMSVNRNNVEEAPEHHYFIPYHDFQKHENSLIEVYDDSSSDGYRLPYYDEWVMLARGGNKNNTPWKDSASFKEISKYAKFDDKIKCSDLDDSNILDKIISYFHWCKNDYESGPVGKLLPNGFGLYDMFGLVEEQVLLEKHNYSRENYGVFFCVVERKEEKKREPFECKNDCPACLKGGIRRSDLERIDYSYISNNYVPNFAGGFRLIRNIGNNAKWSDVTRE